MLIALSELFLSIDFLTALVRFGMPLATGAVGEIISERSGVLNIGLEGMMLAGALGGMLGAHFLGDAWLGVLCGMLAGALIAAIHAFAVITLSADQVVSGAALNIAVLGLTSFVFRALFGLSERPEVPGFDPVAIPLLSQIPILGPTLFNQIPLVYVAYGIVGLGAVLLFRTRWGLELQAVGENPGTADSVGLNVRLIRYLSVISCGMLAGLAGTFYSLGQLKTFVEGMTNGRGFIVLAVVIVANWSPPRAALVALLFGAAEALGLRIQALNVGIPYQLALAFPYVLTLVVYAGLIGRTQMPLSLGRPYVKD